jgi:opacity protein-like surface antigen
MPANKPALSAAIMALAAAASAPVLADAAAPGWSVGGGAVFSEYKFDNGTVDDSAVGVQLGGMYRFNSAFALAGDYYRSGNFEEDSDPAAPGGNVEIDFNGWSLTGVAFLPMAGQDLELFGKAGFYRFDQNLTIDDGASEARRADGLTVGVGALIAVADNVSVRLAGDWFNVQSSDLWSVSLGAVYRFGQ